MGHVSEKEFLEFLTERFLIERGKFDRSGVYAYTQRLLAYNSNKIEGSTLTEEQTASLFDNGTLPKSDDYYRAKDVEAKMSALITWYRSQKVDIAALAEFHCRYESIHPFQDDGVIIGTRLEKPSKINGFALLSPNFFMPERENGITSLLHILLASSMKV